jgi:triacylglycerol lipase
MFPPSRLLWISLLPIAVFLIQFLSPNLVNNSLRQWSWQLATQLQEFVPSWLPVSALILQTELRRYPRVVLRQGTVVGTVLGEEEEDTFPQLVEAFRGIPYALPPVGERRFRPAEKVEAVEGVFDASEYGFGWVMTFSSSSLNSVI